MKKHYENEVILNDLIHEMEQANGFLKTIGKAPYYFSSEITGRCKTYREFLMALKREFSDYMAVLNAIVKEQDGIDCFKAEYFFDNEYIEFEFYLTKDAEWND